MHAADVLDVSWQEQMSKLQILGFPWESFRAQSTPQQIAVSAQLSCLRLQALCASCLWDAKGTQFSFWGRQVQGRPPCTCSCGTGRSTMVLWPAWQRMSAAACSSTRRCGASIAAHSGLHLAAVAVQQRAPICAMPATGRAAAQVAATQVVCNAQLCLPPSSCQIFMMVMSSALGTCISSMIFTPLH